MKRVVCYSVYLQSSERRPLLLRQIVASVESLRTHNKSVPVHVFSYGSAPELAKVLAPYDVTIHNQGSYQERLASIFPRGAPVLSRYPLLHRFLNFQEISALDPGQVLLLDADTIFFSDVDALFATYSNADCYAREEPACKRSADGYDPNYIDEDSLAGLASAEGITPPLPFNAGVLLLNNQLWRRMPSDSVFLSYVWRFAVW